MDDAWLAECYWPGVTEDEVVIALARVSALAPAGAPVLAEAILVVDDEIVLYLFHGATLDAVRELCRRAGLVCERVVRSRVVGSGAWAHAAGRTGV
jgi:hypothetical protein